MEKKTKTCRQCSHRERWQCGGSVIQYCGKRKSNRTSNRLLRIKVTDTACNLFEDCGKMTNEEKAREIANNCSTTIVGAEVSDEKWTNKIKK